MAFLQQVGWENPHVTFFWHSPLKPSHKQKGSRDFEPKILQSGESPEVLRKYLGLHWDHLKAFQVKSNSHWHRDIQSLSVISQENMSMVFK